MNTLPYDYARCANDTCPLRGECLRALSPGRPTYQVYAEFPGGEDCDGLIRYRGVPQGDTRAIEVE